MPGTVSTQHPLPPAELRQQQGEVRSDHGSCRPLAGPSVPSPRPAALELAVGLYRGLGSDLQALTGPVRRRELGIAAQLLAVGATPAEAEAYARDMAALGNRLAPIDLRSFERERPAWLVRHRRQERRHVDRTGLPPTWLAGSSAPEGTTPQTAAPPASAPSGALPPPGTGSAELSGERLGRALRAVLAGGS